MLGFLVQICQGGIVHLKPVDSIFGVVLEGARRGAAVSVLALPGQPVQGQISVYGRQLAAAVEREESSARAVMARYDLRHISYNDLVAMADGLQAAGALGTADYLDFIGPSPAYAKLDGSVVADWNAPRDYLALHEQQLAFLQQSGAEARFVDFARYQVALFRHFDALHPR